MKATKYFRTSEEMAAYGKDWCKAFSYRWYLRTSLICDHAPHEKRKAIVLVERETLQQSLITCKVCNQHGNSLEIEQAIEKLKVELKKEKDEH